MRINVLILFPPIFIDWFTFSLAQHSYQGYSLAKEKFFKPPFKTISYSKNSVISSAIQSWDNVQQKLGLSKTLSPSKFKWLISDENPENYQVLYHELKLF